MINPGNPTGQLHSASRYGTISGKYPKFELVVIDESFIDFAGKEIPSLLPIADRFSNLLIVRSMSKHFAESRDCVSDTATAEIFISLNKLRRHLPTWNINTLAEYFPFPCRRPTAIITKRDCA